MELEVYDHQIKAVAEMKIFKDRKRDIFMELREYSKR